MTLSKGILGHGKELYEFIYENNLKCNIRPAFLVDNVNNNFGMTNEEYFEFFKEIFELWINDEKIKLTQIREIYEEFAKALNSKYCVSNCSVSGNCFTNFISLDFDGNLYSCNRTYNNNKFYYGNINEITTDELEIKMQKILEQRKKYILNSKCKKCELYKECNGGCPANAYSKNGTLLSADDYFCDAKKKIKKYINKYLDENGLRNQYNNYIREKNV